MAYLRARGGVAEAGEPVRVSPVVGALALALVGSLFVVGVALLLGLSLPWHIVGGLVANAYAQVALFVIRVEDESYGAPFGLASLPPSYCWL